jgi:hypothetical protein
MIADGSSADELLKWAGREAGEAVRSAKDPAASGGASCF